MNDWPKVGSVWTNKRYGHVVQITKVKDKYNIYICYKTLQDSKFVLGGGSAADIPWFISSYKKTCLVWVKNNIGAKR